MGYPTLQQLNQEISVLWKLNEHHKTEIETLRKLVRDMAEIVNEKAGNYYNSYIHNLSTKFCAECNQKWGTHRGGCLVKFAQEILNRPEVKEIIKEKSKKSWRPSDA